MIKCPNCPAIWGMEEIEEGYCGACGFPNNDAADEDSEHDPDADEDPRSSGHGNSMSNGGY